MKFSTLFILLISLILVFASTSLISASNNFKYWENLKKSEQTKLLKSKYLDSTVLKYYKGKFSPSDNDSTWSLLDHICSYDTVRLPLNFYLFNKILMKSDAALAEVMFEYCSRNLLYHPNFVFQYFTKSKNINIYTRYIASIADDYYDIDYKIKLNDFKSKIEKNIDKNNKDIVKCFNKFFIDLEKYINETRKNELKHEAKSKK